jgi:hypothetical protein
MLAVVPRSAIRGRGPGFSGLVLLPDLHTERAEDGHGDVGLGDRGPAMPSGNGVGRGEDSRLDVSARLAVSELLLGLRTHGTPVDTRSKPLDHAGMADQEGEQPMV